MKDYVIVPGHFEHLAVFKFDAEELRGIAAALGPNDGGAQEMLDAASHLDELDGRVSA